MKHSARFFLSLVIMMPAFLAAQQTEQSNPYTSPADVEAGSRMYRSHCAECHGLDGLGGRGPSLTSGRFRHGDTDEDLLRTIGGGIPGTEMPGIYFNGQQLWQLVAYVRSLSARGSDSSEVAGTPERGSVVFRGKGGCLVCHRVNGEGSRLGPDLSDVGGSRTPTHLRTSLLRPQEVVGTGYWMVRAVTNDGRQISGIRLNEDTHSVQILDAQENLRSLRKSDLETYEIDKSSTMPAYEGTLTSAEIDDLVAYLSTLQKGR